MAYGLRAHVRHERVARFLPKAQNANKERPRALENISAPLATHTLATLQLATVMGHCFKAARSMHHCRVVATLHLVLL